MALREVGLQLQRVANRRRGFRDVAQVPVKTREGKIAVPGFIVELESGEQSFLSFLVAILPPVNFTKQERRRSTVCLQFHCLLKSRFRILPFERVDASRGEHEMGSI